MEATTLAAQRHAHSLTEAESRRERHAHTAEGEGESRGGGGGDDCASAEGGEVTDGGVTDEVPETGRAQSGVGLGLD